MEKILALAEKLIRLRTEKDEPEQIDKAILFLTSHITEKLPDIKINIEEFKGTKSIFIGPKNAKEEYFLLNGHLDVVPASEKEYSPKKDDEYIYGRGSGDMKTGLAVIIEIFLKHYNKKNIGLLINTDEEMGGMNGAAIYAKKIKPSLVLIPEPTANKICIKEKGGAWIDISVKGPGGHASRPWTAKNAIDILADILSEIRSKIPIVSKEEWKDTMNIGLIRGGEQAANKIAQNAFARIDVRLTENTSLEDIQTMIKDIIEKNKKLAGDEYLIQQELDHDIPHLNTDENNEYVKKFVKALQKETGNAEFKKGHAASDGRFFSKQGIPVIIFGPTSIGHHSDNEKVEIKSVETCYNVMNKFIQEL